MQRLREFSRASPIFAGLQQDNPFPSFIQCVLYNTRSLYAHIDDIRLDRNLMAANILIFTEVRMRVSTPVRKCRDTRTQLRLWRSIDSRQSRERGCVSKRSGSATHAYHCVPEMVSWFYFNCGTTGLSPFQGYQIVCIWWHFIGLRVLLLCPLSSMNCRKSFICNNVRGLALTALFSFTMTSISNFLIQVQKLTAKFLCCRHINSPKTSVCISLITGHCSIMSGQTFSPPAYRFLCRNRSGAITCPFWRSYPSLTTFFRQKLV